MKIRRRRQFEKLLEVDLPGRGIDQVGTAYNMGNPLMSIVYRTGKVIGKYPVRTIENEIADGTCQMLVDSSLQCVIENRQ